MKKAIVTLLIGHKFRSRGERNPEASWREYCRRHDYDLICLDEPLDDSSQAQGRSLAWQKCLILSHDKIKNYDRVVWIDSDVIINPASPCILKQNIPVESVGTVDVFVQDHGGNMASRYYRQAKLPEKFDKVVSSGVRVLSPRHRRSLFEHVYFTVEERRNLI